MPGPTCWAIHGVAQTCPQLAAQGYCLLSSLGCDVVDACPYSCEACTTRKFCDVSEHNGQHTGFADGVTGIDLTCAELAPSFCTAKTSQGKLVRTLCGETCGCGRCPPPSPPAPPLAPGCAHGGALDLVVAMDISASMRGIILDVSRLVREIVLDFAKAADEPLLRMGLVGFNDSAAVLSPLDGDVDRTLSALARLWQPLGYTNIGAGLLLAHQMLIGNVSANAASSFSAATAISSSSPAGPPLRADVPKVIVLVTDGDQSTLHGGNAQAFADAALVNAHGGEHAIALYALQIGECG